MEASQKQVGSDSSSSEENEEKELDATYSSNKRSYYECTFCKRGFTNAQALGGHMNIHRKDRAKAKKTTKPMLMSEDNYMNPRYITPTSSDPSKYYPVFESPSNYHMCHQTSAPSPSNPPAYNDGDVIVPWSQNLSMNQEILGANLSLGLGSTCVEANNGARRGTAEEAELDLELRLGRNR